MSTSDIRIAEATDPISLLSTRERIELVRDELAEKLLTSPHETMEFTRRHVEIYRNALDAALIQPDMPGGQSTQPVEAVDVPTALRFAADVIELYDDATMRSDYMITATEAADVVRVLAERAALAHPRPTVGVPRYTHLPVDLWEAIAKNSVWLMRNARDGYYTLDEAIAYQIVALATGRDPVSTVEQAGDAVAWFPTLSDGSILRHFSDGTPVPANITKEGAEQSRLFHLGTSGNPVVPLYATPTIPVGYKLVPPPIINLSECRARGWEDGALAYRSGWNDCRRAAVGEEPLGYAGCHELATSVGVKS